MVRCTMAMGSAELFDSVRSDLLASAPLTATLSVTPEAGTEPLAPNLTVSVMGGGHGTINYNIWWNCAATSASLADAIFQCGSPADPMIGAKFDSRTATTLSVTATPYLVSGVYRPFGIVERGDGAVAVSTQVIVDPASFVATLVARPTSGVAALTTQLTATIAGEAGGIDYSLWWDCDMAGTDITVLFSGCGALPVSPVGGCAENTIGLSCSGITDEVIVVNHTYGNAGTYTPKGVVRRGGTAIARQATVVVTPAGGAIPIPLDPGSRSEPGLEIDSLIPSLQWSPVEGADRYGIYVSKYPYGEANLVFESEIVAGQSEDLQLPADTLVADERYRWNARALVDGVWSEFSFRLYFTTATCAYSIIPSQLTVGPNASSSVRVEVVAGSDCTWSWESHAPSWLSAETFGICSTAGSASGTVSGADICVSANFGGSRSGTITIGGQTLSVIQGGSGCSYTTEPSNRTFEPEGGIITLAVTTGAGCEWNSASEASWLTISSGSTGSGSGAATVSVGANASSASRSGKVLIAGHEWEVYQGGLGCTYSIIPSQLTVGPNASSSVRVEVVAGSDCTWSWESHAPSWLSAETFGICSTAGSASGTVSGADICVSANFGGSRSGTITIGGQTLSVIQGGSGCSYTTEPSNRTFEPEGGTATLAVTTGAGCEWNSASEASWLTISSGSTGSGSGAATVSVGANASSASRSGKVLIAGHEWEVYQGGLGCTYSIIPSQLTVGPNASSSVRVEVVAGSDCTWSWESHAPSWLSAETFGICSTAGSASGTVSGADICVSANFGGSRSGTITIGGQTLSVIQGGSGCSYTTEPSNRTFEPEGGIITLAVTTGAGCEWNSASEASWLTISSGSTGSGSGAATVSVGANASSASRSGKVLIAGHEWEVYQGGLGCTYSIIPSQLTVGPNASSSVRVEVVAGSDCTWSWESHAPSWLSAETFGVCSTAGSASGTVSGADICVSANLGGSRSGTITIGGQTLSVIQGGSGCSYTTEPSNRTFEPEGGTATLAVTTGAGCEWNSASEASWLTISSGSTGSGSGTATISVAANASSASRSGKILIASQEWEVYQGGLGCTYSIIPSQVTVGPSGASGVRVEVVAGSDCTWSWESHAPSWLSAEVFGVCSTAGSASGSFSGADICVSPNPGGSRSGTITIGGRTLRVFQGETGCSPIAEPAATSSSPVCAGDQLNLFASLLVGGIYTWVGPDNFTSHDQNPVIPFASASSAGTYSLVVTIDGCPSPVSATIAVVNPDFLVLSDMTIDTDQFACRTLLATDVSISGDVTFKAGVAVSFGNGFRVLGGSRFRVVVGPDM
jgi:hypothetical protein